MMIDPRLQSWTLTWAEVDPSAHPFDADSVPAVVRAVAREVRTSPDSRDAWPDALTVRLVDHFGRWTSGWRSFDWEASQGTLDAVVEAVLGWRSYLEELADHFARHLPLPEDQRAAFAAWETAVGELVATAMARTGTEENWYGHSGRVLTWFLSAAGVPEHLAGVMVDEAIGGRFRSWIIPTGAEAADVAEAVAAAVTGIDPGREAWPDTWPRDWPNRRTSEQPAASRTRQNDSPGQVDALSTWRRVRQLTRWTAVATQGDGPARTGRDGIAEFFAARSSARMEKADGLLAALGLARADAEAGGPLTFARLESWQRAVLGVDAAPFRTTSAWAKSGREWYAYRPDLPEAFDTCLAEADDTALPLPSRAARVYLDVAFFHPFADGNARSAALALSFVLAREDVVLDRAESLLMTVRPAGDPRAAEAMARHVAALIDHTRRHAGLTRSPYDVRGPAAGMLGGGVSGPGQ